MTSATVTAPTWTALHVLSRGLLVVSALYGSAAVVAVAADAPLAPLGVALLGVGLPGLVLAHGLGTRASRLVVVSATTAAAVAGLTGVALRLGGPGALWHVLLIGYAVAAVAFFVVFESMVSLSDALDLPWARARWCTARWTSLAPLACVALLTVDPRLLAVLSRIPLPGLDRGLGSSVAAMAALSAPLLAIPLAQIVFGVVATSAPPP